MRKESDMKRILMLFMLLVGIANFQFSIFKFQLSTKIINFAAEINQINRNYGLSGKNDSGLWLQSR